MELAPIPRRRRVWRNDRLRWLSALVVVPLAVALLLPLSLGLNASVVAGDGGTLGRGSLVFARYVPSGDLRAGDVILAEAPVHSRAASEGAGPAALRVTGIGVAGVRALGDPSGGEWVLPLDRLQAREAFHVPWVGYPLLAPAGNAALVAVAVLGLAALARTIGRQGTAGSRRGWPGRPVRVVRAPLPGPYLATEGTDVARVTRG